MLKKTTVADVLKLIQQDNELLDYLRLRFDLKPLSELLDEDPIRLETIDSDEEGLEFEILGDENHPFLYLTLPDIAYHWLEKFKGYKEAFEGFSPRRVFMDDPDYDRRYRILLGLEIAIEIVCELKVLNIGACVDLRLINTQDGSDFGGFTIRPVDGQARLPLGLLPGLTVAMG
jgi:hypothetical protein